MTFFGGVSEFSSHQDSCIKCSHRKKGEKRERADHNFSSVARSALAARETARRTSLSLPAARFGSLTVKRREEAARETEADPLPMVALDFAGLARSENDGRTRYISLGAASRESYVGRTVQLFFIARYFRNYEFET